MKHYDLKIGMKCNNECFHCVIADRKQRGAEHDNMTYKEVLDHLNSLNLDKYASLVITGGEPTTFNYLGRLLIYLTSHYPHLDITVQTNGRLLTKFIDYFDKLYKNDVNLQLVIAIHDVTAELHDKITGVKGSFEQTVNSIKTFNERYGSKFVWRSETVLSTYNCHSILPIAQFVKVLNAKRIGFSYPHLDGYVHDNLYKRTVRDIGFDYKELVPQIEPLTMFIKNNPTIQFMLEEFPPCLWYQSSKFLLPEISNIQLTCSDNRIGSEVSYMGEELQDSFEHLFANSRRKYKRCEQCSWDSQCNGIWQESYETFENEVLQPIPSQDS